MDGSCFMSSLQNTYLLHSLLQQKVVVYPMRFKIRAALILWSLLNAENTPNSRHLHFIPHSFHTQKKDDLAVVLYISTIPVRLCTSHTQPNLSSWIVFTAIDNAGSPPTTRNLTWPFTIYFYFQPVPVVYCSVLRKWCAVLRMVSGIWHLSKKPDRTLKLKSLRKQPTV